ncbi:MAG: alpha/beta fold hydrolase, partial [Candidatus Bipolaricaulota bacterium]|nr:alpha/beta fold hydrolase [Candidatus Bipolaricaulota bacterium]
AGIDGGRIVATSFGAAVLEEVVQSGSVVAALDPMFPSSCLVLQRAFGAGSSAVEGTALSGMTVGLEALRLEPVETVTLSVSGKDDMGTVQKVILGDDSMSYYMQNGIVVGFAIPSQELFAYREDVLAKGFLVFPRTVVEMGMPVGVAEQDYTFVNQGTKLAGTFTAPPSASAKMPGVLLVPDIGPFDRQGNTFGLETRILRDVARRLAQQGIASYRFDPRGVGASEGDFASVSLSDLESDALIALILLKNNPLIDPEKVYIVGFGAGGVVALRLAANGMANGVGTMATSASSLGVSWIERLRDRATADGASSAEVEALIQRERAFLEFVRGTTGTWKDIGLAAVHAALPWMNEIEFAKRAEAMPLPLLRNLLDVNPLDAVRAARNRLFVLEGTKDFEVPASDADLFAKAAREGGNQSVTTAVVENVNHLLRAQLEGAASLDRHIEEEVDWGVLQPLLTWMGGPIIPTGGPGSLSPAS